MPVPAKADGMPLAAAGPHTRKDTAPGQAKAANHRHHRVAYTGESLDWHLISAYANANSQEGLRHYKNCISLLPTVEHIDVSASVAPFKICAWCTNGAKNDLSVEVFVTLCLCMLVHAGYRVEPLRR
jgi:hypothetical protein